MRVQIKSKSLGNIREYRGRNYGEQQAAIIGSGDYPLPFKVNVEVGKEHEPGDYTLDEQSFATDQHGNLQLKRVRLAKIAPAAVAKAS